MVTITVSGADKSGSLARISAFFVRKGYRVTGSQLTDSASGAKLVKISLDATQIDQDLLAAEIRSLNPDYSVVDVTVEGS
jgi:formyltetrahydrofolate hydrolase